jgi:hypothetical protein
MDKGFSQQILRIPGRVSLINPYGSFFNSQLIFSRVEHSMAKTYENGTEFMKNFNMHQDWTEPIKVLDKTGLGLKMPNKNFDIKNVVGLLG